jgi:uncharacterized protein YlxW (UPF0749 family)
VLGSSVFDVLNLLVVYDTPMEPNETSYGLVAEQLRDLLSLQQERPASVKRLEQRIQDLELLLKAEQCAHGQTSHALEEETHKLNFALGEIDVLTRRLENGHTTLNSRWACRLVTE